MFRLATKLFNGIVDSRNNAGSADHKTLFIIKALS
jgi:hypothetical protein